MDVVATIAFGNSFCTIFGVRLLLPAFRAPMAALDNAFNMIEFRRRWKWLWWTVTNRAKGRGKMCRNFDELQRVRPDKMDDLRLCCPCPPRNRPDEGAVCSPLRDERHQLSTVKHVFSPGHRTAGNTVSVMNKKLAQQPQWSLIKVYYILLLCWILNLNLNFKFLFLKLLEDTKLQLWFFKILLIK